MSIQSTCEGMNEKLDSYLSEFESIKEPISNMVDAFDLSIDDIKDESGIPDLDDQLSSTINSAKDKMNTTLNSISNFTGSCLDGIQSSLNNALNSLDSTCSETMTIPDLSIDFTYVNDALDGIKSLIVSTGLQKLLEKIDELLGCLSDDNDCIPIDKIDNSIENINSFLDSQKISSDGSFDIDSSLSDMEGIDFDLIDNIKSLSNSADSLGTELKELTAPVTASNKYTDILKW